MRTDKTMYYNRFYFLFLEIVLLWFSTSVFGISA